MRAQMKHAHLEHRITPVLEPRAADIQFERFFRELNSDLICRNLYHDSFDEDQFDLRVDSFACSATEAFEHFDDATFSAERCYLDMAGNVVMVSDFSDFAACIWPDDTVSKLETNHTDLAWQQFRAAVAQNAQDEGAARVLESLGIKP